MDGGSDVNRDGILKAKRREAKKKEDLKQLGIAPRIDVDVKVERTEGVFVKGGGQRGLILQFMIVTKTHKTVRVLEVKKGTTRIVWGCITTKLKVGRREPQLTGRFAVRSCKTTSPDGD